MSRHSKRSRANPRTRQHRAEAKAKRRATRAAKGRTKGQAQPGRSKAPETPRFVGGLIGGIPQHTPEQVTRAMLGLR